MPLFGFLCLLKAELFIYIYSITMITFYSVAGQPERKPRGLCHRRHDFAYDNSILLTLLAGHETSSATPGGVLPKNLGRGVRPASQNPNPIYDQNLLFSLPYL